MYFETGQGSRSPPTPTSGVDQLTCEARNYGIAGASPRSWSTPWSGSSARSTSTTPGQIIRAGLEDHFMGKLHGISMGCDACYTNHADADQNDLENLELLLAAPAATSSWGCRWATT
jgi:ethanolamine ammonia-lyase large subunit